jgi:hypothetical protein
MLNSKQTSKRTDWDLILLSVSHPHKLLPIDIKEKGGIKVIYDLIILVLLGAHHFYHLTLITRSLDLVEDGVTSNSNPIPVDPLGLRNQVVSTLV